MTDVAVRRDMAVRVLGVRGAGWVSAGWIGAVTVSGSGSGSGCGAVIGSGVGGSGSTGVVEIHAAVVDSLAVGVDGFEEPAEFGAVAAPGRIKHVFARHEAKGVG